MENISETWNGNERKVGRKLSIALHPNLLILNPRVLLEDGMEPKTLGSVTSPEERAGKEERQRTSEEERGKGQISWHRSDRALPMKTYRERHLSARDALD